MHCNGCARMVEKHISKMDGMNYFYNLSNFYYHITRNIHKLHAQMYLSLCISGVTSYQIDLETKMVVIMGDIVPFEVVESIAKVKNAEFWQPTSVDHKT